MSKTGRPNCTRCNHSSDDHTFDDAQTCDVTSPEAKFRCCWPVKHPGMGARILCDCPDMVVPDDAGWPLCDSHSQMWGRCRHPAGHEPVLVGGVRFGGGGMTYDSRADTLIHSQRVGELMAQLIHELVDRSMCHDRSKTAPPEVGVFDEFTPKLKTTTYGSDEYRSHLAAMGEGLKHHYASNRHHPEHHRDGVNSMTLADLAEMLADWKAATERHADGDLYRSLTVQRERFAMSDQLTQILFNTARAYGWMRPPCGAQAEAPDGTPMVCNVPLDGIGWHWWGHADGRFDGGQYEWWDAASRRPSTPDGNPAGTSPVP